MTTPEEQARLAAEAEAKNAMEGWAARVRQDATLIRDWAKREANLIQTCSGTPLENSEGMVQVLGQRPRFPARGCRRVRVRLGG